MRRSQGKPPRFPVCDARQGALNHPARRAGRRRVRAWNRDARPWLNGRATGGRPDGIMSMRHTGWGFACLIALAGAVTSSASASVVITFDKSTQQMTVAVDGVTRWQWAVSTGRNGYDTPSGTFRTFRMEAEHYSKEWDDAPMPHSIFFTKSGHAIHGYLDTRNIGVPASHGCVRLHPTNASQLYALVAKEGVLSTTVVLRGDTALARRGVPSVRSASPSVVRPASPSLIVAEPQPAPPPQFAAPYRGSN